MYILINMSKKLEGFNLYQNCFYPLLKDYSIALIDLSRKIDDKNIDYDYIRESVEGALVKANTSKYSIILLYDFNMQVNNPLLFSTTAILNNFSCQIINTIRHRYVMDSMYFIVLDDVERDFDGQIISKQLKDNIFFDKHGYINDSEYDYYFNSKDFTDLDDGLMSLVVEYEHKKLMKDYDKLYDLFDNNYLKITENRIIESLNRIDDKNIIWYRNKLVHIFTNYRKELKDFLRDIYENKSSIEDIKFDIQRYLEDNVSSYQNTNQNKIFRLNLLDKQGKYCRDEEMYKNYYKIIMFIYYLVKEDKKYIFGGAYNINENHYNINIYIKDDDIANMLNAYNLNLINENNRLGDVKFSDINIEEYEHFTIDTNIENTKKYTTKKPHYHLFKFDENLKDTENYALYLKERYVDYVNYCNQRLRKITDKLRITKNKSSFGRKISVSLNELQRLVDEKTAISKELQEKISSNTPNDIIPIDFQIFDENEKKVNLINEILNKRITIKHFIFNILIIMFSSFVIFPMLRRFDIGLVGVLLKSFIWIFPSIIYILVQLIFCKKNVDKALKFIAEMDNYTKKKIHDIHTDDEKFKEYVNDIYELMMITKYIDKLKLNTKDTSLDIENYRFHKETIEKALQNLSNLSKLLKIKLDVQNVLYNKNIIVDIDKSIEENDLYCPFSYTLDNEDNYVLINNQHKESINHRLLNVVDSIKIDYDEVYDEK